MGDWFLRDLAKRLNKNEHPDSAFAISGDEINMQKKKKLPGGEAKNLLTKIDSAPDDKPYSSIKTGDPFLTTTRRLLI